MFFVKYPFNKSYIKKYNYSLTVHSVLIFYKITNNKSKKKQRKLFYMQTITYLRVNCASHVFISPCFLIGGEMQHYENEITFKNSL